MTDKFKALGVEGSAAQLRFKAKLEASLAQAEHLSRALDKLLPRVGRTISHGPFEPTEVVDEPYKDPDENGDDE